MPRLKQPASLEVIVLQSIEKFILQFGQRLIEKVCSGTPTSLLPTRWGLSAGSQNEKSFNCYISSELQPYLDPGLPVHLSNAVSSAVLEAITLIISRAKCTYDSFAKSGDDCCRTIAKNLISLALHDRITQVDLLERSWFIGEVLLEHLDKFQHLQVLKLWPGSWSPVWTTVVEMLESGCCSFRDLISFSMRCHCTDKILQVVAYSSKLQYLDVMSSVEVTDLSVKSLLHLRKLKIVNMASTWLTAEGYIQLLVGLPQLDKLVWFDLNGQALGDVRTSSPLSLHSYEASRVSIDQLNIMVHKCPFLTQVNFHWVQADLSVLGSLKCIRDIKLAHSNAVNSNLRGLLEIIGYNITSLELQEVVDVDLLMIGVLCMNLKKLSLVCSFQASDHTLLGVNTTPLFRQLEELRYGSQYSECLFFNCINIRRLEVIKCLNFNDQVVATLLSKNPLRELQVLSVGHCGNLSCSTVLLLLDSCINLRVLEGLDRWGGVTKSQVMELESEMKRKNLDLEIIWKKPLHINW
ncbi:uncharacterized protein [Periplaneta americana]|uniref:uncharacterized protein n=1 Tax=Periplaneta americana TaxID=6978 RepID=UPI0037E81EA4